MKMGIIAFSHTCVKAYKEKKLRSGNIDLCFISKGYFFVTGRMQTSNLKAHETCHSESFLMIFTLPNTSQNVGERLLSHLQQQRAEIQFCFLKKNWTFDFWFSKVWHWEVMEMKWTPIFFQLLRLRGEDDPKVISFFPSHFALFPYLLFMIL